MHGSWTESLVAGRHRYVVPVNSAHHADGRGLSGRIWPRAQEVPLERLRDEDIELVILQRPEELALTERWLGRRPGIDVPAVYVEHNAPRPSPVDSIHRWRPWSCPREAGVMSADVNTLAYALRGFLTDRAAATLAGKAAREFAIAHFSVDRFLSEWDEVVDQQCA